MGYNFIHSLEYACLCMESTIKVLLNIRNSYLRQKAMLNSYSRRISLRSYKKELLGTYLKVELSIVQLKPFAIDRFCETFTFCCS